MQKKNKKMQKKTKQNRISIIQLNPHPSWRQYDVLYLILGIHFNTSETINRNSSKRKIL